MTLFVVALVAGLALWAVPLIASIPGYAVAFALIVTLSAWFDRPAIASR
jgi:hypothetical protein